MEEKFKQGDEPGNPDTEADAREVEFTNDPEVDRAVDQIVNEESDKLLNAEDEALKRQFEPPAQKKSFKAKLKNALSAWWNNKRLRYGTFISLGVLLVVSLLVPFTRYGLLNLVGVRVSSSMTIVDSETGLPLENIPVKIQNKEVRSNEDGYVSFSGLKQGASLLKIDKQGYAQFEKSLTLGWGSNPLGEQAITATGTQYTFVLRDWQSQQPLKQAEATSGEDVAQADDEGRITLTVGEFDEDAEAILSAVGYRAERLKLSDLKAEEEVVDMVPAKKHAFVSNRNGEYDLYKIDVDGKNEEVLLEATKKEREIPFVLPHQSRDFVAYVSSRDGDVNKDNFILDGLFVIDVTNGDSYKVTRSEQLQVIGWSGNKLVYVAVSEGVSAGNSQRSKLVSYDLDTKERVNIAAANYFNDVKLVDDTIYYAISSYAVPQSQAKLFSTKVDGKNKRPVVDIQIWSIIRKDYTTLLFNGVDSQWFEQEIGRETKKLDTQPTTFANRIYSTSPNKERAIRVDVRDGKGVLLVYDTQGKTEEVSLSEPGLSDPVHWISDSTVVYRIDASRETADYVLNLDGGEPRRIADVVGNRSRYFY